jgi:branched-chain amino acid transport system substrate-binding protein
VGNPTYPGNVIKLGGVCSLTGPIYYGSSCKSAAAYFRYVNEQGGVNGITFDYRFLDDGVDQQRNLSAYRRLVEDEKVLATVASGQNLSFLSAGAYLEERGVPLIGPAYANKEENRPNVVPLTMWVADFGGQPADYFVQQGRRAMCIVYANIYPARNALRQTKWLLSQMGHPEYLKDTIPVSITEPDYSGVVVRFKSAGCDSVLTFIDPASVVRYTKAANQQGFHPPTIIPIGAWTPELAAASGTAGEGTIAQIAYDLPVTGNPEAKLYEQQLHKYFPGEVINAFAPGGWVAAKAVVDAVSRIDGEVTRDKLMATLQSMKGWDPGLSPPINIGDKPPTKQARFYVQRNGDWVPLTGFLAAPPLCPDCLTNDDVTNIP